MTIWTAQFFALIVMAGSLILLARYLINKLEEKRKQNENKSHS